LISSACGRPRRSIGTIGPALERVWDVSRRIRPGVAVGQVFWIGGWRRRRNRGLDRG
jgi:hypothetical protein